MKSRASLVLMEQLIMVLVFALSAALCLGLFTKADLAAEEIRRQDIAVVIAQNAAEQLKMGMEPENTALQEGFSLEVRKIPSGVPGLNQAELSVSYYEETVYALVTGWQEVGP